MIQHKMKYCEEPAHELDGVLTTYNGNILKKY